MQESSMSLRLISIIAMAFGLINLIITAVSFFGAEEGALTHISGTAMGATMLLAGVIGYLNHDKPYRMPLCFILGLLSIAAVLANIVALERYGQFTFLSFGFLVLPIVYIVEVRKIRKNYQDSHISEE